MNVNVAPFNKLLQEYAQALLITKSPPALKITVKSITKTMRGPRTVTLSVSVAGKDGEILWSAAPDQTLAEGAALTLTDITDAFSFTLSAR